MRLSQEDASWKDDICPLYHMERNAYLSAIHKAIGAMSEARIAATAGHCRCRRHDHDAGHVESGAVPLLILWCEAAGGGFGDQSLDKIVECGA